MVSKDIHYLDNVEIETYVEDGEVQNFVDWMVELTSGQGETPEGDVVYLENDVE